MSNVLRIIKLAVALILFIIIVSIVMLMNSKGTNVFKKGYGELNNVTQDIAEIDIRPYINTQVTGDFVISTINRYKSTLPMRVYTGAVPHGFYDITQIQDKKSNTYINPQKQFVFYTGENSSGDLEILIFVQDGLEKSDMGIPDNVRIQDCYNIEEANKCLRASRVVETVAMEEAIIRDKRLQLENLLKKYSDKLASADINSNNIQSEDFYTTNTFAANEEYKELLNDIDGIVYGRRW